eukprot:g31473.t1
MVAKSRCSNDANFDKTASEMSTFFLNHGFPSTIIDRALSQIRPISRTSVLTRSVPSCNSDRVLLVCTYHPMNFRMQGSLAGIPTTSSKMPPLDTYSPPLSYQHSAGTVPSQDALVHR